MGMNKREPLISILIPCYNNQKFIYELLDTVFRQTYHNFEVIIADDGSEDFNVRPILGWLMRYKPEWAGRVMIYQNEKNLGTVANMEGLHRASKGEYLFNIAADDVLYNENVLQAFVDKVNELEFKGKKPDVIMAQLEMWDHQIKNKLSDFVKPDVIELINKGDSRALFARSSQYPIFPAQYLYHRSVSEKIGKLSEKYRLVEDWPAALRMTRLGINIFYMDTIPSSKHRDGGISHGNSIQSKKAYIQYYTELIATYHNEVKPYQNLLSDAEKKYARSLSNDRTKALFMNHIPALRKQEEEEAKAALMDEIKQMPAKKMKNEQKAAQAAPAQPAPAAPAQPITLIQAPKTIQPDKPVPPPLPELPQSRWQMIKEKLKKTVEKKYLLPAMACALLLVVCAGLLLLGNSTVNLVLYVLLIAAALVFLGIAGCGVALRVLRFIRILKVK